MRCAARRRIGCSCFEPRAPTGRGRVTNAARVAAVRVLAAGGARAGPALPRPWRLDHPPAACVHDSRIGALPRADAPQIAPAPGKCLAGYQNKGGKCQACPVGTYLNTNTTADPNVADSPCTKCNYGAQPASS